MSKQQQELWLLLSLVVIAGLLNFLVSSQRVVLCFFFLPTLYSAYSFGRRHAVLTAFASVFLVVALNVLNPVVFSRHVAANGESPWFDLAAWGGILVVSGYAMGTLYERNQKSLAELQDSYDGIMVILQHFLANEKYSSGHAYRVSLYVQKIGEAMGLDSGSVEDVRTAALLQNMSALGISHEVLLKIANLSKDELAQTMKKKSGRSVSKAKALAGTLQRAIPILVTEQNLTKSGSSTVDAALEVQILALADAYETMISSDGPRKMSPAQAEEVIAKSSGKRYDTMVVDAFVKAFGQHAQGAGA
jgi:hypothetical protein